MKFYKDKDNNIYSFSDELNKIELANIDELELIELTEQELNDLRNQHSQLPPPPVTPQPNFPTLKLQIPLQGDNGRDDMVLAPPIKNNEIVLPGNNWYIETPPQDNLDPITNKPFKTQINFCNFVYSESDLEIFKKLYIAYNDECFCFDGLKIPTFDKFKTELNTKQNTLISGENIKTINGNSLLGDGNLEIQGGTTYNDTELKAKIATLEAKTNLSDFTNDTNFVNKDYVDKAISSVETQSGETSNYFTPTPILSGFTGIVTTTSPSAEIAVVGNLPIGFVWWNKQDKRYFINKGINPSDETKLLWQEVKYAKDLYDDNNGITWELLPFDEIEIKGGGSNQNYGFCVSNLQLTDINGIAYTEPKAGEVIDGTAYPANTNATAKRFILIDGEKYYFSVSSIDLSIYGGSWARSPMAKSESGDYNAAANSILLGYSVATSGKDPNGKATKNFTLKIKFEKPLPLKIMACDFYSPKVGNYASSITEAADHYLEVRLKQSDMTISGFRFENIEAYSGIPAYCAKFRVATNCVGEIYMREFGASNINQYVVNLSYKPSILLD